MKKLLPLSLLAVLGFSACVKEAGPEPDFAQLDQDFQELVALSGADDCTGDTQWRIAPVGSKPCGGPSSYLPYSTAIDTTQFLQRVAEFTAEEKRLNEQYGQASDCSVEQAPTGVNCVDGSAELIYPAGS
ncbi:MAG: hypothetical protein INR69_12710 [Mucilaginibacter polytrichastri]|nr:hypothetical protein [Mucilaginibacter polytrichastri]